MFSRSLVGKTSLFIHVLKWILFFTFISKYPLTLLFLPGVSSLPESSHIDDMYLLWDWGHLNEEDSRVSLMMTTMWTNFVKFGHPTPDLNLGVIWDPVNEQEKK